MPMAFLIDLAAVALRQPRSSALSGSRRCGFHRELQLPRWAQIIAWDYSDFYQSHGARKTLRKQGAATLSHARSHVSAHACGVWCGVKVHTSQQACRPAMQTAEHRAYRS